MDLDTWMTKNNITAEQLAKNCEYSVAMIKAIRWFHHRPGRELAKKLEAYTNGQVTAQEMRDLKYYERVFCQCCGRAIRKGRLR